MKPWIAVLLVLVVVAVALVIFLPRHPAEALAITTMVPANTEMSFSPGNGHSSNVPLTYYSYVPARLGENPRNDFLKMTTVDVQWTDGKTAKGFLGCRKTSQNEFCLYKSIEIYCCNPERPERPVSFTLEGTNYKFKVVDLKTFRQFVQSHWDESE